MDTIIHTHKLWEIKERVPGERDCREIARFEERGSAREHRMS